MTRPFCRSDSFMACLAYHLTHTELNRVYLRRKLLFHLEKILTTENSNLLICRYFDANFSQSVASFLEEQKFSKDTSYEVAVLFSMAASNLYDVNIILRTSKRNLLTLKPLRNIFQSNTKRSIYIVLQKELPLNCHVLMRDAKTMLQYSLRVCDGCNVNRHVGTFNQPNTESGRLYSFHLPFKRTDLIYLIYPGNSHEFYLSIPDNQSLYVFSQEGECLASANNEYKVYPYFCLPNTSITTDLYIALAANLKEAKAIFDAEK